MSAATQSENRTASQPHARVPWQPGVQHGVSTVQTLGFNILVCFLFMIFSRIFDMHLSGLHIPGISERLMAAVVIVTGSFWRPFRTSIGKRLLWFTIWIVVGLPFSVWKGESFTVLTTQWWADLVVFTAVSGLIADFQQYRRSAWVLAVAILALCVFCLHYGTLDTGRLFMANGSRFSNPNDMAQAMLIGIPFWLALYKRAPSAMGKIAAAGVLLLMLYIIAKTGSRGALVSFAVLYLVMLYHASPIGKAGLMLGGSLAICASIAFLPSALKDRYKTLFSEDKPEVVENIQDNADDNITEDRMLESAETSAESRRHLLRQSLILTATHPVFGVGIGEFQVAENALAISQGKRKGSWLGTHNSYMQVASETGVPGVFFFVSILYLSLKRAHSLYRSTRDHPELREISTQAEALFLSLICLGTTDLFIHAPYTMLLPVLAGLTISLEYTATPLMAAFQRRKAEAGMPAATVRQVFPAPVSSSLRSPA